MLVIKKGKTDVRVIFDSISGISGMSQTGRRVAFEC